MISTSAMDGRDRLTRRSGTIALLLSVCATSLIAMSTQAAADERRRLRRSRSTPAF